MSETRLYSELQPHRKLYPKGSPEDIILNSKDKVYNYMYNKAKEGLNYTAITYFGNVILYADLFSKIEKYAKAFKNYGIGKGDFVTLTLPNIPETIYIKYALNRIGAVANLVDPRTNPEGILHYATNSNSKMIISSLEILDSKIKPIEDKVRVDNILAIPAVRSMDFDVADFDSKKIYLVLKYKEMMFKLKNRLKSDKKYLLDDDFINLYGNNFSGTLDTEYEENQPFSVCYTGGTSGTPKSALLSNESYNATVEQMTFGTNPESYEKGETFLAAIPFFVVYGSGAGMHNSLCRNWNIITLPKYNPNEFDLLLKRFRPTNSLGVPRFYGTIIKNQNVNDVDFSFLKRAVVGGSESDLKLIMETNEFLETHGAKGVKIKIGYGATELGGCASATSDEFGEYNPTSSGYLLLGCSGMIIDPVTGKELPIGEAGEICINSPSMMLGYLNNEEETEKCTVYDQKGMKYYRTGDKGYFDEKGALYFIDRYKRCMDRPDGHTVHASPLEKVILSDPRVESCIVVGIKEKGIEGDIPTAFIKLKDPKDNFAKVINEIDVFSLTKLSERDKALAYCQIDDIKYTLLGKEDYQYYEQFSFEDLDVIFKDSPSFPILKEKPVRKRK